MATLVARNANEAMAVPTVESGGVYVSLESGVRHSVSCACVWWESVFSRHEAVPTLVYFMQIFYTLLFLQCDLKENAAINYITFQN
jgi:hypothetical protein